MIKAISFDLDHTLFDRYETLKKIVPFFKEGFKISEGITDDFIYENLSWADKNFVHIGWTKIFAHLCSKGIFAEIPEYQEYEDFVISKFKEIADSIMYELDTWSNALKRNRINGRVLSELSTIDISSGLYYMFPFYTHTVKIDELFSLVYYFGANFIRIVNGETYSSTSSGTL